jgi:RNA polymerase sigma factor (sigma-70 family)
MIKSHNELTMTTLEATGDGLDAGGQVLPLYPESAEDVVGVGEIGLDNSERANIIHEIHNIYRDDKRVKQAVSKFKNKPIAASPLENSTERYFQEISQFPVLETEDTTSFFQSIDKGLVLYQSANNDPTMTPQNEQAFLDLTVAYEVVYNSNLRFVVSKAKKYISSGIPLQDLIQYGNMGLEKAITHFDVSRGFKFTTLAGWWIRQTIVRGIEASKGLIKVPGHEQVYVSSLSTERVDLANFMRRKPTAEEFREYTGKTDAEIRSLDAIRAIGVISLSQLVGPEGNDLTDSLAPLGVDSLNQAIDDMSNQHELQKLLAEVRFSSSLQRLIISLSYNVNDVNLRGQSFEILGQLEAYETLLEIAKTTTPSGMGMPAISKWLGISKWKVTKLKKDGLIKLRASTERRWNSD